MQAEAAGLDRSRRVPVAVVVVAQALYQVRRRAGLLTRAVAVVVLVAQAARVVRVL